MIRISRKATLLLGAALLTVSATGCKVTQTQDGTTGTPIETYAYDATGNRTALTTSRFAGILRGDIRPPSNTVETADSAEASAPAAR